MFATRDDYRVRVPPPLADEGEKFWRFCELSSNLPWYLITLELGGAGQLVFAQSVLVCSSTDLLEFVKPNGAAKTISLQRMQKATRQEDGWRAQKVVAVYDGGEEAPSVVFVEVEDEPGVLTDNVSGVSPSSARLVARLP